MYAIVNIKNNQFRVEPDAKLRIPLMDADEGTDLTFDDVLLYSDGETVTIGQPRVDGCVVSAEVVRHGRTDKVSVFKKKRRKNYRRNKSHRQDFTEIVIKAITA
jgi:large subunit ribosomal protein L21